MKKISLWGNTLIIFFLLGFPGIALSTSTQTINVSVTVDGTAPTVISTTPNTGATGVSLTQDVIVIFSEPMDTSSLGITSSPDPGGWTTSWNASDTQLTCSHNPFDILTTYTFRITAAKDKVGNDLSPLPYLLAFTTFCSPPQANFTADDTSPCSGQVVCFTDQSSNSPTGWSWDLDGDGTSDTTAQNPCWTFHSVGVCTVTLIATNTCGSDTKTDYIIVLPQGPLPDLTVKKITLCPSGSVELGKQVRIVARITNQGDSPAQNVVVRFYDGDIQIDRDKIVRRLGPNSSIRRAVIWQPRVLGIRTIKVVVDPEGAITELNETNNELSQEVEVFLPQGKGAISGKITDANTKEPIYKALIIAKKRGRGRFSTGFSWSYLDGGYTIGPLAPGSYRLLAIKRGYRPQFKKDIEVKAGEITEGIDFELNPRVRRSIALGETESDGFDTLLELFSDFLREDSDGYKAPSLTSEEEDEFFDALVLTSLYLNLSDEESQDTEEKDLSRARISILPEDILVSKEDEFEVEISLSKALPLLGVHLELKFDPDKLQAIQITEGELLTKENGLTKNYPLIDNDRGKITLYAARTKGGSLESGVIAKIRFKTISGDPAGRITIEQVDLRDSLNNSIETYGINQVNISKSIQDLENVYCYPNPTKIDKITFANLPDEKLRIKIFDIAGEKVLDKEIRPINGEWEWELNNEKGKKVSSGIYIYLLSNKSLTKRGKLAIK